MDSVSAISHKYAKKEIGMKMRKIHESYYINMIKKRKLELELLTLIFYVGFFSTYFQIWYFCTLSHIRTE